MIALLARTVAACAISLCIFSAQAEIVAVPDGGVAPAHVVLEWKPPVSRTDGTPLSPREIGGYILRVNGEVLSGKIPADAVTVTVGNLDVGEYCFRIATRDLQGQVGPFSDADCWSVFSATSDPREYFSE
ncbi:MAG: hypothetical protein PVG38_16395 [Gammaproteobacteria bacterium]|jgi:hypothetical protein